MTAVNDAIRIGGLAPSFLNNRAATLSALGEHWGARAEIAHAIAGAPRNSTFRYQWGLIELALGHPEEAVVAFRSVLTLNGDHVRARRDLAIAAVASGHGEEGERILRDLLQSGAAPEETRDLLAAVLLVRGAKEEARRVIEDVENEGARRALARWMATGTTEAGSRIDRLRKMLESRRR